MKKLTIIGNVTGDATIRDVNGKNVINWSVACNEKYTNQAGTKVEKATFFKCAYWKDNTAVAQYIKKGDKIYVEGIPDIETYEKEGKTIANIKINVRDVVLLGGKKNENATVAPASNSVDVSEGTLVPTPDSDIPF